MSPPRQGAALRQREEAAEAERRLRLQEQQRQHALQVSPTRMLSPERQRQPHAMMDRQKQRRAQQDVECIADGLFEYATSVQAQVLAITDPRKGALAGGQGGDPAAAERARAAQLQELRGEDWDSSGATLRVLVQQDSRPEEGPQYSAAAAAGGGARAGGGVQITVSEVRRGLASAQFRFMHFMDEELYEVGLQ